MAGESDNIETCSKRYMTMEQLCDYLSITKWTVYRLIARRDIPYMIISKRAYRFDQNKIDQWMARKAHKTVAEV